MSVELARKPRVLTECTCSICRRYAAFWAYCTPRTARVICVRDATTAYRWNDEVIEFHHCNRCGCLTHYTAAKRSRNMRIAVNARMLPPDVVAGIRIRIFDGARTWRYVT